MYEICQKQEKMICIEVKILLFIYFRGKDKEENMRISIFRVCFLRFNYEDRA